MKYVFISETDCMQIKIIHVDYNISLNITANMDSNDYRQRRDILIDTVAFHLFNKIRLSNCNSDPIYIIRIFTFNDDDFISFKFSVFLILFKLVWMHISIHKLSFIV